MLKEVAIGKVEASLANTRAGTVEACQRTKLSTIVGGRIEYLGVKEGDKVKKGQLLLKLWNDDQQAQAALSQSQVTLAGKRVDEACIAAVNAEKEAKRQTELREKGFVSSSREEAARTDAEGRRARSNIAKADVAQAEAAQALASNRSCRALRRFDGTVPDRGGSAIFASLRRAATPPAMTDRRFLPYVRRRWMMWSPHDQARPTGAHPLDDALRADSAGRSARRALVSAVESSRTVDIGHFEQPEAPARLVVYAPGGG